MSRTSIVQKVKANRTRPAEIEGEPVKIRVYSAAELKKIFGEMSCGDERRAAEALAAQFLDETGEPIFTADFILSDDCTNVFMVELLEMFVQANSGDKKK